MFRVGNRVMDVYTSSEFKPQSKGAVQGSADNSGKAVRKDRDSVEIHDLHTMDAVELCNYIRDVCTKTVGKRDDYLQELWDEEAKYLKEVRTNQKTYGFDDIGTAAAHAYSVLYQRIVEGHRNGTRELYVYEGNLGKMHRLTLEEDLEKLDKGFERLIEWDVACAKSQYDIAKLNERLQNKALDDSFFDTHDREQACEYIRDSYTKFRSRYLEEYEKNSGEVDVKSLFMSILKGGNQGVHDFCKVLFGKMGHIA